MMTFRDRLATWCIDGLAFRITNKKWPPRCWNTNEGLTNQIDRRRKSDPMAGPQLSAAARTAHMTPPTTHPSANPGYGKRSTPGQQPAAVGDFAHLPDREAAIALYLDRLPDGADISVKTLATILPYGQCALRTALQCLRRTGHLRIGREHVRGSGSARWVTRTWFSRTPRDNAWWAAFVSGDLPSLPEAPTPRPTRSRAYILLAARRPSPAPGSPPSSRRNRSGSRNRRCASSNARSAASRLAPRHWPPANAAPAEANRPPPARSHPLGCPHRPSMPGLRRPARRQPVHQRGLTYDRSAHPRQKRGTM